MPDNKNWLLVTGGAGFIGSNFIKCPRTAQMLQMGQKILVADALTYSANYNNIAQEVASHPNLDFLNRDIRDSREVESIFECRTIEGVIHFAAESDVDWSIHNPHVFVETNVIGTLNLLDHSLREHRKGQAFRFLYVSTDEVYGSLSETEEPFSEQSPLRPNNPYSASKASGDMLVRSFSETYQLPVVITRCSNNFGPYQTLEKLIPRMIDRAFQDRPLPVYGDGQNIRDWIHVDDHCQGLWDAYQKGTEGEIYNFAGNTERRNLDVVKQILHLLEKSEQLIEFVTDRPGHDYRYALDISKAGHELGWSPQRSFEEGLAATVEWYLRNRDWVGEMKQRLQER